jgi:HEAT repeat protein
VQQNGAVASGDRQTVTSVVVPAREGDRGTVIARPSFDGDRAAASAPPATSNPIFLSALGDMGSRALPWIVPAWLFGVTLLSIRLMGGWFQSRRYGYLGTRTVPDAYIDMLDRLRSRLRIARAVRILESTLVHVPAVIGWLRPVVLVPASAFTGLTPQQIEVLIAHELAHVRRHDYLINLLQAVVETLLFYHPAVWWISRRVRDAREQSCDDIAVATCGDARLYARALLDMEELRGVPRFAMAANGGSLATRIRRLLLPHGGRRELFPRWIAGAFGAAVALLIVNGRNVSGASHEPATAAPIVAAAPALAQPDTIIRHPDPSAPLSERWRWAHDQADRAGFERYSVAYGVEPAAGLDGHAIYVARANDGRSFNWGGLSGNFVVITDRIDHMRMRSGAPILHQLLGGAPDDVALLYGFDRGRSLAGMQIASLTMAIDLAQQPLFWLGPANDDESVFLVQQLYGDATNTRAKDYLTIALGIHEDGAMVVPLLAQRLQSNEHDDVRETAVEWLAYHPRADALSAITRAARSDRSPDIRAEAAEALGDMDFSAATDSLIVLASELRDTDARSEAVEGLGQKQNDPRAVAALARIARNDPQGDIQREAVESLGETRSPDAQRELRAILREHPNAGVRDEALETIAESSPPGEAAAFLEEVARTDPHPDMRREAVESLGEAQGSGAVAVLIDIAMNDTDADVQREAVEALGEIRTAEALAALRRIVADHQNRDVRREAIESLGENMAGEEAIATLTRFARTMTDGDLQREAVESLAEIDSPAARDSLMALARTLTDSDVRLEAIESVGESVPSDAAVQFLGEVARSDQNPDVQREAVESLGEMQSARAIEELLDILRTHPDADIRREAVESIGEAMPSERALRVLIEVARTDTHEDVQHEVLESLEELSDGAGIPALIEIARTHPNRELRIEAIKTLAESDHPQAREFLDRALRQQ